MQMARVTKTDAEWKKQLSPLSYEVTRKADTERPGSGKYVNNHASGIYRCICCDTPSTIPRPSLNRAQAGRVSGNPYRVPMSSRLWTPVFLRDEPQFPAPCAMRTSGTCLMTDQSRQVCAIA
jgi:hypothetical protein